MRRFIICLFFGTFAGMFATVPQLWAQADADDDGLPDEIEQELGTDPAFADRLQTIGTFTRAPSEKADMQFARVEFGNVGRQRWLWAIHFQKPYSFRNSLLILYLDTDNNPETGRKGMGCEYMFSHNRGNVGVQPFAPDGSPGAITGCRVALYNGILYMCVDCTLKQEAGRSVFRYMLLSEYSEPHTAADSTGWISASGPPDSERKVVLTIDDIKTDENFLRTEGLDLIWQLQRDPANICFRTPEAELHNMRYYDAEYRWWAVHGANGRITITVPRAGLFYPAVVVYDTTGAETYQMFLEGKPIGHFVAAEDDRRQRIYFLNKPIAFQGGEKLVLKTGSVGAHITEDIMLLGKQPPIRERRFEIRQIESGAARREGQEVMRITWITTWPAACTIEYWGPDKKIQKVTEPEPVANHRLFLNGLRPGLRYGFRILAPKPDGSLIRSADQSFIFRLPPCPAGRAQRARVPLWIENPYDFPLSGGYVSNGVPFAQGELGDPQQVRLLNANGQEEPLQTKALMYWPDGSIKWLLVTFQTDVGAKQTVRKTLEYGRQVTRQPFPSPLTIKQEGDVWNVETGRLRVRFDLRQSALPTVIAIALGDGWREITRQPRAIIKNAAEEAFDTQHQPERVEWEETGPLRAILKVVGHHQDAQGKPFFAYILRYVFYAGQPYFRLYYTFGNDEASEFTAFKGLALQFPLPEGARHWTTAVDGAPLGGEGALSLRQREDNACQVEGVGAAAGALRRADGWLDVSSQDSGLAVAVRDFWQLWPKGLTVEAGTLRVELCPAFPAGTYDGRDKLEEIKLYYYLLNGQYKIRQGVQKQHELLLYPHAGVLTEEIVRELRAFQEPLIAVCPPERYCGTNVLRPILPATAGRSPDYERVCENVYRNYISYRESNRNYGMLNFGDQFGERRINWANGEYDHHHAFLMQFVRTGERRWYFLGEKAARHAIDVDTCHYGPRRGGEWIHSMGHTGGYYDRDPFGGQGIAGGHFTPSHTWTEGFCDWFALSGDVTAMENAALVADHYDGAYLNNYDYSNCRDNGWHLLLTMAAYHATNDPYYLNAARIIVERTLERATPGDKPGELVGWHRQMVPGHCYDMPRHRGEANFMLGVLANALEVYYGTVPDPRVAEAVKGGARQAVKELWVPEVDGFRYTSCPNMKGYTANNDMTAEVLFFAYRLGGDPEWGEIAMRAMKAAFREGIGSIAHLRWTPHIIYNMDLLRREGLHFAPQPSVRIVLHNEKTQSFEIRLTGQGAIAWPELASLAGPNGQTTAPDKEGVISLDSAPPGYYVLTVKNAPVPWRLETTLRSWVVDASSGVELQAGQLPMRVHYYADAKTVITPEKGSKVKISPAVRHGGQCSVTIQGPGRIRIKASAPPWIGIAWGEVMNPSVPFVQIEGPQTLLPGALTAEYTARVTDLDNDVVAYEWDFGAGETAQGPSVKHTFRQGGAQTIRLRVRDRAGHSAETTLRLSLPPPELAGIPPERLIRVEAEDFVAQGLDEVRIFERIGASRRMISYWDATRGHWLEWRIAIPEDGDYVIYLRYCSGAEQAPQRAMTIDGQSPGEVFAAMTLPPTGGFSTTEDNWAFYAAGGGQPVHLTAGEHRLRLTNLGGGVGLDYLLLVRR